MTIKPSDSTLHRDCVEYCGQIFAGAVKAHLALLDSIERRAKRLMGDPESVEAKIHSLKHRLELLASQYSIGYILVSVRRNYMN